MPGTSFSRLSPWLCCVPSGSRDQNTTTNGLSSCLELRQHGAGQRRRRTTPAGARWRSWFRPTLRSRAGRCRRASELCARQARGPEALCKPGREPDAARRSPVDVVEQHRLEPVACRVVEDQRRAELADRGGVVARVARRLEHRFLVEEVARVMFVDVAQDGVVLDEGRERGAGRRHREAAVDRVGEIARVAEEVPRGHRRSVGHREGREHRMAVAEEDARVPQRRHGRGRVGAHDGGAKPVGDEQHDVVRARRLCRSRHADISAANAAARWRVVFMVVASSRAAFIFGKSTV